MMLTSLASCRARGIFLNARYYHRALSLNIKIFIIFIAFLKKIYTRSRGLKQCRKIKDLTLSQKVKSVSLNIGNADMKLLAIARLLDPNLTPN